MSKNTNTVQSSPAVNTTNAPKSGKRGASKKEAAPAKTDRASKVARVETADDSALADFCGATLIKGLSVGGKIDASKVGRKGMAAFLSTLASANKGRAE